MRLRPGCAFEPRCPERMAVCAGSRPAPRAQPNKQQVSCFKYE
jgi:ABC-type dipeptide/oligopeptide/nickel transport system ATPase component